MVCLVYVSNNTHRCWEPTTVPVDIGRQSKLVGYSCLWQVDLYVLRCFLWEAVATSWTWAIHAVICKDLKKHMGKLKSNNISIKRKITKNAINCDPHTFPYHDSWKRALTTQWLDIPFLQILFTVGCMYSIFYWAVAPMPCVRLHSAGRAAHHTQNVVRGVVLTLVWTVVFLKNLCVSDCLFIRSSLKNSRLRCSCLLQMQARSRPQN